MVETKGLKIAVPVALIGAAFVFAGAMLPVFKAYAADTVPTKSGMALATTALTMAYSQKAYPSSNAGTAGVGIRWTSDVRGLTGDDAFIPIKELEGDKLTNAKAHNKKIPPLKASEATMLRKKYANDAKELNDINNAIEGFSDYWKCYNALYEGEYLSSYRPDNLAKNKVNIGYFANCCGTVGQAVHMSGVDDNFPWVKVGVQAEYMHNSDMWKYVGIYNLHGTLVNDQFNISGRFDRAPHGDTKLLPGDILVLCNNLDMTKTKGEQVYVQGSDVSWDFKTTDKDPVKISTPHIFMYVGKELVQDKMVAGNNAVFVESNWGTRYTHVTWGRESVAKDVPDYRCLVFRVDNSKTDSKIGDSRYGSGTFNPPAKAKVTAGEKDNIQKNFLTPFYNKREEYYNYDIQYNSLLTADNTKNPATYRFGKKTTISALTLAGYTFKGWTGSNGTTAQKTVTIPATDIGKKTYTANWEVISYNITYNLAGGTNNSVNPANYDVTKAVTLKAPTRVGYTFKGWTGANGTTPQKTVTIPKGSTGNKTYTANWVPVTYTISYTLNGGTVSTANPASYTIETATFTLNNPKKTGYTFKGWTGANGTTAQQSVSVSKGSTGNKSFTANWTVNSYTVKFDGNGATSGKMSDLAMQYGTSKSLTANAFSKKAQVAFDANGGTSSTSSQSGNCLFTGWATTASGNKKYDDGANVSNLSSVNGATVTLYAVWGDANIKLPTASRAGYTFAGWYSAKTGGTKIGNAGSSVNLSDGTVAYAHWTKLSYNITYNLDGGTNDSSNPVSYDVETAVILKAPTRSGYTFKGWTGSNGSEPQVSVTIPKGTTGGKSYKANWTPIEYAISFNGNGATSGNMLSASFSHGQAANLPLNKFARVGHTFSGWAETASGNVKYMDGQSVAFTSAKTLYAVWNANIYSVAFNGNGATSGGMAKQTMTYGKDEILSSNTFSKRKTVTFDGAGGTPGQPKMTGTCTFAGWAQSATGEVKYSDGQSVKNLASSGTVPLYAKWNAGQVKLPDCTRTGYVFEGWYSSSSGGSKVGKTGDTIFVDEDIVLHARYSKISYSITYNLAGGQASNPTSYDIESQIVLAQPVRDGYLFSGWTGSNGTDPQLDVQIPVGSVGSKTYTANWTPAPQVVTFNGNGATSGNMGSEQFSYGVARTLPANAFVRTGYSFAGWSESALGLVKYSDRQTVSFTSPKTLYAVWHPNTYEIKFDGNGADSGEMGVQQASYDESVQLNANAFSHKASYVLKDGDETQNLEATMPFEGWASSASGSVKFVDAQEVSNLATNGSVTLYAKWGMAKPSLPVLSKDGYSFDGWTCEGVGNGLIGSVEAPDGSEFIAMWTKDTPLVPSDEVYAISYDYAGGSAIGNPEMFVKDKTAPFKLVQPIRNGYVFTGWTGVNGNSPQIDVEINTSLAGDLTFVANWRPIKTMLKFQPNGGSGSMDDISVAYDDGSKLPNCLFSNEIDVQFDEAGNSTSQTLLRPFTGWRDKATGSIYAAGTDASRFLEDGKTCEFEAVWGSVTVKLPAISAQAGQDALGWRNSSGSTHAPSSEVSLIASTIFVAEYSSISYKLELWDGTDVLNTFSHVYGDALPELDETAAPVKFGYSFKGWNDIDGTPCEITTMPDHDLKFFASWEKETYSISIDPAGGIAPEGIPSSYNVESPDIMIPAPPERSGYIFAGWQDAEGNVFATVTIPTGSVGDKSFKALWVANGSFTVSFLPNGGSGSMDDMLVQIGTVATLPTCSFEKSVSATFEDNGKIESSKYDCDFESWREVVSSAIYPAGSDVGTGEFEMGKHYDMEAVWAPVSIELPSLTNSQGKRGIGWVDSSGTTLSPGSQVTLAGDETFSAVYVDSEYLLTLVSNHEVISIVFHRQGDVLAELADSNAPKLDGYNFSGWQAADGTIYTDETPMPSSDLVLTASWEIIDYPITVDTAGGSLPSRVPDSYNVESPDIEIPEPLDREGFSFAGWDCGDGVPQHDVKIPLGSIGSRTFTALWISDSLYTVIFVPNGGSGEMQPISSPVLPMTLSQCTYERRFEVDLDAGDGQLSENPEIYVEAAFVGWKTLSGDVISDRGAVLSENFEDGVATLQAQWSGELPNLPAPQPAEGQVFTGWVASADTTVNPGDRITSDVVLRADYDSEQPASYTVSFDANGGVVQPTTSTFTDSLPYLPEPNRYGYTFDGWFDSVDGGTQMSAGTALDCDITLYAHWSLMPPIRIQYDLDGGAWPNGIAGPETVPYSVDKISIPVPSKKGHTFAGFACADKVYTENGGAVTIPQVEIAESPDVKALWIVNEHKLTFVANYPGGPADAIYTIAYDSELPKYQVSRSDYIFNSWSTSPESLVAFPIESRTMPDTDVVLYANWDVAMGDNDDADDVSDLEHTNNNQQGSGSSENQGSSYGNGQNQGSTQDRDPDQAQNADDGDNQEKTSGESDGFNQSPDVAEGGSESLASGGSASGNNNSNRNDGTDQRLTNDTGNNVSGNTGLLSGTGDALVMSIVIALFVSATVFMLFELKRRREK